MYHSSLRLDDEGQLIECCLRGDAGSWEKLFEVYHPKLVTIIKIMMRGESGTEQAEDIAATIWSSLCSEPYAQLRRFDPEAGRLIGFLVAMARREIWRVRRSTRSRFARECSVARKEAACEEAGRGIAISEFLATLTRREQEYCMSELLSLAQPTAHLSLSACNEWKLRSRVLKKFRNYFLEQNTL